MGHKLNNFLCLIDLENGGYFTASNAHFTDSFIRSAKIDTKMTKKIIIYGGCGALGRHLVEYFKKQSYSVVSIDMSENAAADKNVLIAQPTLVEQGDFVMNALKDCGEVDAVISVAGGWCGGNASTANFIKNVDLALKQSVWTSAISSHVAAKHLKAGGFFVLPGAAPVIDGATPGMIAYGASKAGVHHMLQSVSSPKGGLADNVTAVCLAPIILDTPNNRKFMPKADFTTWTPLDWVAGKFHEWTEDATKRPANGSTLKLVTKNNETELVLC